jgi:hypothetical protein
MKTFTDLLDEYLEARLEAQQLKGPFFYSNGIYRREQEAKEALNDAFSKATGETQ